MKKLLGAAATLAVLAACSNSNTSVPPVSLGSSPAGRVASVATSTTLHVFVPTMAASKARLLMVEADGYPSTIRTLKLRAGRSALGLSLTAGTHVLAVSTYATSKPLSSNILFVSIADCAANDLYVALYVRPAAIAVTPENNDIMGSLKSGFQSHFGEGLFGVVALDRHDETIVGPGSPAFAVTSSNRKIAVTQPDAETVAMALATTVPFDNERKAKISIRTRGASASFLFTTEFTTWPTPPASPSPAPCTAKR